MRGLWFSLCSLVGTLVCAQNTYDISGNITDDQNQLVSIGDALLFPIANDTLVAYTSIIDGAFLMPNIPEGSYRLRVSCLGFEDVEQNLVVTGNLVVSIQLVAHTTNLEAVEVVAARPVTTNENGNLKIDVTNPVFSAIPDPMELLSRLPNLQVSPDWASVTILGKGTPLVYLGNQRISMEEFNALTVDDISTIEIIRNPSAKYEANGRAVLLITRKSNLSEGFRLNLSETLSFKRNFNNYSNINGSYHSGKVTLKANFAYNDLLQWESHQFEFGIPDADIFSDYLILVDRNDRIELNGGGGLFYQINDTDYFSANTTFRSQTNDVIIATDTFLRQGSEQDDILTETNNQNNKRFGSANLNYARKLNTKTNVFAGIQYSSYEQRLDTEIANNYNTTAFDISQLREQRYRINVLTYRMDFDKKLTNDLKWEFGANNSIARANAQTNIQFLETASNLEIDYDYSESTIAAYTTLSGELGEKVQFNGGLRVENNTVKGEEEAENIPLVNRRSTNLFPKANLTVELDSTKHLTFNYGKSIDRPNYSSASSIQIFFNPFLEGEGNVNLLPTVTEDLSAVFQFGNNSLSIEYFKRKNPIYYTIGYTIGEERAVFSLKNLERESGLDINFNFPITKGIWTSTNAVSLSRRRIQDATASGKPVKPYVYFYTDHQFKIGKETTVSFGAWGLTKRSEGIFERNAMVVWNAALTKTFFKNWNCALRFNDITRAMNYEESYAINGVVADGVYFVDAQEVALSIKYTFGNSKDHDYNNKEVDENLDRIK
ncbi:TonB-dependent receptor [Aggregatimonas sangjinii]|uniref:TonB-dependent receptor n=1 Tax=Aggregatimonas sangjinii TaxID=2583587 RepID=A0A5B7SPV8_9FLAO|nr:outer membrane beta-barrel family protein [Aggregatimonas sangjinii]QCW99010.1 TonB-dependent receptor [Aggregatimonas sangjinii]